MAAVENSKYHELCRLCAIKTTMVLAVNIFENEGTIRQISKKICTCLPIQVHESDELPKMICENCLYKLEMFFEFREKSQRTERLLVELYKEINSVRAPEEHPCVVPIDHELIMVQHHQLLAVTDHNMQNVADIDLSQLSQREGMIVGHEIILTHHSVDMSTHSLDSIDLHNHDLTNQDLSNQSLQTQESLMADSNPHSIQDPQFSEDNLSLLQQHQLLADQFRLQHDVSSVNIVDESSGNDIHLSSQVSYHLEEKIDDVQTSEYDPKLENPFSVGSHSLGSVHIQEYDKDKISYETNISYEDSNSDRSLLVDEQLNVSIESQSNSVQDEKQIYNLDGEETNELSECSTKDYFYCNLCGKQFEQKCEFDEHFQGHFHTCKTCLAVFTNIDVLNAHRKEVHSDCVEESKPVKTRLKRATVPVKSENGEKTPSPSEESETECDNQQIKEEEDFDTPNASFDTDSNNKRRKWSPKVCKECGKSYKTNYKLAEHMRKHTGEKPYKCKSCEKAFRSKIGLAQHEAKHTGQYDFSCPVCGKGFQCKSYLMVHQRVHSDLKLFPCTTCGQNFKTKQSLVDHTNRHLGVKPYICDICGRGFITKGLCRAHQKVHSGQDNRKYSCKICTKMFVSKSYLQTHLRIHTGEKPFLCEVCGKGFLTRVDLKIHSTMHTGEKSYVCEICNKAFARRDALRCHRRSHTGERPYSCDLCGQTFTQFTPMVIHKRLHTGERPYACDTCGKTFVSRSTMMSHAKKHLR